MQELDSKWSTETKFTIFSLKAHQCVCMEELIREPAQILKINIIEPEWDHFDSVENKRK